MRSWAVFTLIVWLPVPSSRAAFAQSSAPLNRCSSLDRTLVLAGSHTYTSGLTTGKSAAIVTPTGTDLTVDPTNPKGTLLVCVDSPNGREGDEPVELLASQSGVYQLRVRSRDTSELAGRDRISEHTWSRAPQTTQLLQGRAQTRQAATHWLHPGSAALPAFQAIAAGALIAPLDALARRTRVLGLAETTHGSRSRDGYMATHLPTAPAESGPGSKAASGRSGALLREALGCAYGGLGLIFGSGGFIAPIPNGPEDHLQASTRGAAPDKSIEGVPARLDVAKPSGVIAWPCEQRSAGVPAWLQKPQSLHRVEGLYRSGSLPPDAFRFSDLLQDFDGVLHLPPVGTKETSPARPLIPPQRPSLQPCNPPVPQ